NPAVTSLRKAITEANATPEADTIQFSVTGTINLTGALPYLSGNLIYGGGIDIQGPGAGGLTVRGDSGGYRIFAVPRGATVGISGLTIANGASTLVDDGGGIYNEGTLTVSNCTLSGNSADQGAGIYNKGGALTVINSTLSGNSA